MIHFFEIWYLQYFDDSDFSMKFQVYLVFGAFFRNPTVIQLGKIEIFLTSSF